MSKFENTSSDFNRRYSTNGTSFGGLFSSIGVTISDSGDFTISKSFLGLPTVLYQGSISDIVSMDLVSAARAEHVYFHARIEFRDGRAYELPMPMLDLTSPGAFEELRNRVGLRGTYSMVEGGLPRWGLMTASGAATA